MNFRGFCLLVSVKLPLAVILIFALLCNKMWKSLFFHSFSGHTSAVAVHCFPVPLKFYPFLVSYRKYLSVYIIRGKKEKAFLKL